VGRSEGSLHFVSLIVCGLPRYTYIVKQSAMKATANGLMVAATSSGMGGASLRLPSL